MRTYDAPITDHGQVTLPMDVRRHLGVEPGTTVTFVIAADGVRLMTGREAIEAVRGEVAPLPAPSTDFDAEIEEATAAAMERRVVHPSRS